MPKLSDTMEEGTIVEWKKKSGDVVKKGEVIAEVESDKATFDLESEDDGVLNILVEQGVPAKIGAPIARIGEAGAPTPAEKAAPAPEARGPQEGGGEAKKPKVEPKEAPPPPAATPKPPPQPAATRDGHGAAVAADVKASPLAKRLAAELGVNLAAV